MREHNANTGFVRNERCPMTPMTSDQDPSNTCRTRKLVGGMCPQAGTWNGAWLGTQDTMDAV
eukprot:9315862-Prorocentrum_lima.AAC.1